MKKYILLFAACGLLAACDPMFTLEMAVDNTSSKDITLHTYRLDRLDSVVDSHFFTVSAGEKSVLWTESDYGTLSVDYARNMMRKHMWYDSTVIVFPDGKQLSFTVDSVVTDGPYHFTSTRYNYLEKNKEGHSYYGEISYTVTPADYAAALLP